jgi:hypothetical protein
MKERAYLLKSILSLILCRNLPLLHRNEIVSLDSETTLPSAQSKNKKANNQFCYLPKQFISNPLDMEAATFSHLDT